MNSNGNFTQSSSAELTREELADVAYMCYILDRTQTTRWYHEWRVALDRMGREGWTMKGLYYRGLVMQKIEQVYGLSPFHSRRAVKAYPPVNLGLECWQDLTDECIRDIADQVYREYMGLPLYNGYAFHFGTGVENGKNADADADADCLIPVEEDSDDEDLGGFSFV